MPAYHLCVSLAVAIWLSAPLGAQCAGRESRGPFAGSPLATVLHGAAGYRSSQLYLKPAGLTGQAPAAWPTTLPPGRPQFDLEQVFRSCPSCATSTMPVVDALSMGDDWVLADCSGRVAVPPFRWGSILFSVTRSTAGAVGSAIRREVLAGSAQADVFTWVLPGSVLPPDLVATTHRAQDAREMGLPATADVAALDLFIPFHALDARIANPVDDPVLPGMMPAVTRVFFSLTKQSASRAPACWFGSQGLRSGASILQSTWDETVGRWSCPQPWMTFLDLGLSQAEDIDALGIDLDNRRMLFSTDISIAPRDPLLYFTWDLACPANAVIWTYTMPSGDPVSEAIGLTGSDDIDAICAMDPSVRRRSTVAGFSRGNAAFYTHGTPHVPVLGFAPPTLNATAFRAFDPRSGALGYHTFMVGWPLGTAAPGFGVLLLTPTAAFSPAVILATPPRNPALPYCGGPTRAQLTVPPIPALVGADFMLRWLAVDNAARIAEAYPVVVTL